MITRISVRNFKSIKEIGRPTLKPLTIFTGVNASGKSSIMEAISFFAQASRLRETRKSDDINPVQIFTSGDLRRYPYKIENFIPYKKDSRAMVELGITIKPDERLCHQIQTLLTEVKPNKVFEGIFKNKAKIESVGYSFRFQLSRSIYWQKILINNKLLIRVKSDARAPVQLAEVKQPKEIAGSQMRGSATSAFNRHAFSPSSPFEKNESLVNISRMALLILDSVQKHAQNIFFISGERGKIEPEIHIREHEELTPSWVGANGQHLMQILSLCSTRTPDKAAKIQKWANKFQLGNIRAGYIGGGVLESNFRDNTLNIDLNSTLAGLGSRQILSLITQIFWSEPGSVIMVEEPEISLHPENQVLLHELFSEAISEGKQIICSTHSPFFVLAISRIVKKKLLPFDDIAVYEVKKDKEGTHAKPLKLNKHGFIIKGVPSFMKVERELFKDWSETLEEE